MNKKIRRVILFGTLPLSLSLLAGCGKSEHVHNYVEVLAKEATCDKDGNAKYFTCKDCDKVFDENKNETKLNNVKINALGHDLTHHASVPATDCQHTGTIEYWHCNRCDGNFGDNQGKTVVTELSYVGNHKYVDVSAHDATCVKDGNTAYSFCEVPGCGKYFNEDHSKEIEKDSWVIEKFDHLYDSIDVTGDYEKYYSSGDTFDSSNLTVYKVCSREKCGSKVEVEFQVVYEKPGESKISSGDTKVTIKSGDLTKDLPIYVDKLPNAINGLLSSYTSNCKNGISTEGISCLSGDLEVKYFSEATLENELTTDELIGGSIYYILFKAVNFSSDYAPVSEVRELTVQHIGDPVPNKDRIGFSDTTCTVCGATGSGELMGDQILTKDNHFHSGYWGVDEGKPGIRYGGGQATETYEITDVALPWVNYKAMDSITFIFKVYGNTFDYSFGIVKDGDLLPRGVRSADEYGTIKIAFNRTTNVLDIEAVSNVSKLHTVSFAASDDVINGNAGLKFFFNANNYRGFYLEKALINHTHEKGSYILPTNAIGARMDVCDSCGTVYSSSTPMETSDIVHVDKMYGITGGLATTDNVGDNKKAGDFFWQAGETYAKTEISLPRVVYPEIKLVRFAWTSSLQYGKKLSIGIGESENNLVAATTTKFVGGVITVSYDEVNEKLLVSSKAEGKVLDVEVTDKNIINGIDNLLLNFYSELYREFFLRTIELGEEHIGTNVVNSKEVIGYQANTCTACGEEVSKASSVMTSVNLADGYATSISCNHEEGPCNTKLVNEKIQYVFGRDGGGISGFNDLFTLNLPRANFELYKSVTFNTKTMSGWFLLGFDDTRSIPWGGDNAIIAIKVEKQDDGSYKASINYELNTTVDSFSMVIDDENVLSGEKSLSLLISRAGNAERILALNSIDLVLEN